MVAVSLASVGCTMCPDPFDYSGPVPNGSSPQNDFRARSNGILPLGAAPKPWPLLVRDGAAPPAKSQDDEPTPTLAEEPEAEDVGADLLQQTVAVLGESDGEQTQAGTPDGARVSTDSTMPTLAPVPGTAEPTVPPLAEGDGAEGDAAERPATSQQSEALPAEGLPAASAAPMLPPVPAGETPGWRARRR